MRQCDGGDFRLLSGQHVGQPVLSRAAPVSHHDLRHGAQIEQPPNIPVAHLRDPPDPLFAAGGMRFGGQAEPGGVVPRAVEVADVRRRRRDDRRRELADARDRHQTLARLALGVGRFDLTRQPLDPRVGIDQLLEEEADGQSGRFRHLMQLRPQPIDVLRALRCNDAELCHVGADRVADLRALANQKIPRAVDDQDRRASFALHGDEPHRGTRDRFTDGRRVGCVRLPALHVGLHVRRRHQPDVMPQFLKLARPVVSAPAGLHADQAPRQLLKEREQLTSTQLATHENTTVFIDTVDLENALREVDTDRSKLGHGRLLSLRRQHPDYAPTQRREQEPSTPSIEQVFAKLKADLRKTAARTLPDLQAAIRSAFNSLTPTACRNCLVAAGYDAYDPT